ncbi:hypothetical protein NL676_039206 [Syzygium grande]|nr:hypothetical protein NL676_039206 [Syzygium grande]
MSGKPIEDGTGKFDKFVDEPDSKESDSPINGMYHTVFGFSPFSVFHKSSNQMRMRVVWFTDKCCRVLI